MDNLVHIDVENVLQLNSTVGDIIKQMGKGLFIAGVGAYAVIPMMKSLLSSNRTYTRDKAQPVKESRIPRKQTFSPDSTDENLVKQELKQLVNSLRKNFTDLENFPRDYSWRMQQLLGLTQMILENEEEMKIAAAKDIGRTNGEWFLEYNSMIGDMRVIMSNLHNLMKPRKHGTPLWMQPASSYVQVEPYGVVAVYGAFNYSLTLCISPLAGALAAGNCAILKPSEQCPAQSKLLAELIPKYLDNRAVAVVEGGVTVSQSLLEQNLDFVFYTGGGQIGSIVGSSCARRLIPFALELGGKSPTIIAKDANLLVACRRIAQAKWVNSGATCIAPDHVYVEREILPKFVDQMKKVMKSQLTENPKSCSDYSGRVINQNHYKRIVSYLGKENHEAKEVFHLGSEISDEKSLYIAPTILVDTDVNSKIMRPEEEIFGPILPIVAVDSIQEAVYEVNKRPKPLALYIFSESSKTCDYVLKNTSSGSACTNEAVFQYVTPLLPFGGVGPSGTGNYHGTYSFECFSHHKSVLGRQTFGDVILRYPPFIGRPDVQKLFKFLMSL